MQEVRFLKKFIVLSLLVVLIVALSLGFSSCQFANNDNDTKEVTFENITFVDGEVILSTDGHPNPDDFIPEKEGHTFKYWVYKKNDIPTLFKTENYNGEPLTLYAFWKATEYTVKFVNSDGTVYNVNGKSEQKVKHGTSAIAPENPELKGYQFLGWDKSFSNVTEDLVITAKFEKIERKVCFIFEDEILVQKNVYLGDKISNVEKDALSALSPYTSHGLTLAGWYSDSGFKNKVNIEDIVVNEDFTAYAKLIPSEVENMVITTNSKNNTFVYGEDFDVVVNVSYTTYSGLEYKISWYVDGELLAGNEDNKISINDPEVGTYKIQAKVTSLYNGYSSVQTKEVEIFVAKKFLSVKVNDITISYGDAKPQFTYTVESNESLDLGVATYSCDYNEGDSKGDYTIKISSLSSDIYQLNFIDGTLSVVKKNIEVKVDDTSITYGDDIPSFNYTADGLLEKDTLTGGNFECTYSKGMPVGNYVVSLSGLENANYNITEYKSGKLTVQKMELQIKIESKTKVYYGDPQPVFEYKIRKGKLIEGDSLGTPKYNCEYGIGANADRYRVTLSGLQNSNYNIQIDIGWLTVYPKEVQVNWTTESKYSYSGADQSQTVKAMFYGLNDEIIELNPSFLKNGVETTFVDAGDYTVSVKTDDNNYKLLDSVKMLTVNKLPITIEVHDATVMYGDDIPEYKYTTVGIIDSDNLGKINFNCSYQKGSKIGTYQLKAVGMENSNYEITYINAILTVTKRVVTIEWSIGNSYTYNGKVQSDTIHALYKKYDGKNTVMTLTYYLSDKVAGFKNAGTYRVVASTEDANYEYIDTEKIVVIEPKPLVLTLENKTITYGDVSPIFTFHTSGLVNGETDSILGKPQYVCEYIQGKDAGEFEIGCKPLTNNNYDITIENATLTVNKLSVDAIWTYKDSYTYNGQSQSSTISVKFRGYAGNYLVMNVAFAMGEYDDFYHAGEYTVTAYSEDEKNYIVNHKERTFSIGQKEVTLLALPQTIAYGDSIPEFTYTPVGLVGDDDLGKMSYSCAYAVGSPVSSYEINIVPFECMDYDLSYEGATLSVTNRLVNIVWQNLDTYIYNKKNQSNTVIAKFEGYTGEYEVAELNFTSDGKAKVFQNAGEYLVTATHSNSNYTLINETKVLSIEKKEVNVTTQKLTLSYGDNVPKYEYIVLGLEKDDTLIGETFICEYRKGSSIGTYELSVDFIEQENYTVNLTSSMISVKPLTVSVVWNFGEIVYNGATQNNQVNAVFTTYDGKEQSLNLVFTQNNQASAFKNVGEYVVKTDYVNENYVLTNTEQTTVISPKDITVTVQDKNTVFGDTVTFTHTVSGLVSDEDESVLGRIKYLCEYEKGSPIGLYQINAEGLANSNYNISYVSASLNVSKRNVVAEWTTQKSYVYNGLDQCDTISAIYKAYTGESVQLSISITSGNSIFKNAGTYVFSAKNNDNNYSVSNLTRSIIISKAEYKNITHGDLVGTYDPNLTLGNYLLNEGFRWADDKVLPIVKQSEYKALYNVDSENFNDYELNIKLTLSKANYENITHSALSGTYSPTKRLSDYALSTGYSWVNKTKVPTVDVTIYNAIFNADKDNYNDFELDITLNLKKADYQGITHKTLSGVYSPTENLSRFTLDNGFIWADESIIPTVNVKQYNAVYNRDKVNYNDFILKVTVNLSKAVYSASEIPTHSALTGTYNANGKLSDFALSVGFSWKNPQTKPTVSVKSYEALYNKDKVNYVDFELSIGLILSKADYINITHGGLSGTYSPDKHLSNYTLNAGFAWSDKNIVPTVDVTKYKAVYNADKANYNDFELYITLNLKKANYGTITHKALSGEFDPNKTLNDYELDANFVWTDGSIVPSPETNEYSAIYNADPVNYNNKIVLIKLIVTKVDYTGEIPTHAEIKARYDSKNTLADYELEEGFSWVDPTFVPTLGREEYQAYYNPNPLVYNNALTTVVLITTLL